MAPSLKSFICCILTVLVLGLMLSAGQSAGAAEAPEYHAVAAKLVQPRDGLGNVLQKLRAGKPVKIGYLGGSITAANGWRVQSREWFQQEFPEAKVEEINAAIGGTGSDLGVFRVQRDVLQHKPDLLFVEFAVNDGGASPERIWKAMEGIVRQTWAVNSKTDICFVYTFRVNYENALREGECPRAASAMELLADHYGIPSVNFALKVVEMEQAGKLIFKSDEPTGTDLIQFSKDGVHPLNEGHQIYTDVLADAIRTMSSQSKPVDHASQLQNEFVHDHWQAAKMIPLDRSMLSSEWNQLPADEGLGRRFGNRMGTIWEATTPGATIHFQFRGSSAKLYDLLGPDGGQVVVTVDGEERTKPIPRFDSYCTYHRLATLFLTQDLDSEKVHTVIVEIHPEQPDRQSVAFRLKNPEEELKGSKFQGTCVRVSHIMLLGDLE